MENCPKCGSYGEFAAALLVEVGTQTCSDLFPPRLRISRKEVEPAVVTPL